MTTDGWVLVVDDDRSARTGLARMLRSAGYAVETFGDARELLRRLTTIDAPCCIVTDVRMPGMDGLALQEEVCAGCLPVSVVFLTGFADVATSVRAMKRGAVEFLQKPVPSQVLLPAVEAALRRARESLDARHRIDVLRERYGTLTSRERQVFALVTSGLLNKQVGFQLGTSEKTVKVQRARVVEKMGARSLADLVRMADRLGIASGADTPRPVWDDRPVAGLEQAP